MMHASYSDESHVVGQTIDMDHFYEFEDNFDGSGQVVKYSLYALAASACFIAILAFVFI